MLKNKVVIGEENIPKNGPVIFIGNHQNGLIDALLIPTTTQREIHFLARAGAFKNKYVAKFLKTLNMIPVFRIRDGIKNIENNNAVFTQCAHLLKEGKALEIFAEGEHHLERRIYPLKKGFARIILEALQLDPTLKIQIVPVGLNYNSRVKFPSSVSIIYGKPILANNFINPDLPDYTFSKIKAEVKNKLKELTLHIDDVKNYESIISKLEKANVNYLNPKEATVLLHNLHSEKPNLKKQKPLPSFLKALHKIAIVNSILPLTIWRKIKPTIKEKIFTNTFRFAVISTLFPIFFLLQSFIVNYFFGFYLAILYLIFSVLLGLVVSKTSRLTQQ